MELKPVTIKGEIAEVPLTRGLVAIIDVKDADTVAKHNWHVHKVRKRVYARTHITPKITITMHRLLLGVKEGDAEKGDHINHDTLDNRRQNLRLCSNSQNCRNAPKAIRKRKGFSTFKGVAKSKAKNPGKAVASIFVDGKTKYLGTFPSQELAAKAYDKAALNFFGEFACLNFPISKKVENI